MHSFKMTYTPDPVFPTDSKCFICGRFGAGSRTTALRRCRVCDTTWQVPPVSARVIEREQEAAYDHHRLTEGLAETRSRFFFRPLATFADVFDDFVDHGRVSLSSPA